MLRANRNIAVLDIFVDTALYILTTEHTRNVLASHIKGIKYGYENTDNIMSVMKMLRYRHLSVSLIFKSILKKTAIITNNAERPIAPYFTPNRRNSLKGFETLSAR